MMKSSSSIRERRAAAGDEDEEEQQHQEASRGGDDVRVVRPRSDDEVSHQHPSIICRRQVIDCCHKKSVAMHLKPAKNAFRSRGAGKMRGRSGRDERKENEDRRGSLGDLMNSSRLFECKPTRSYG